MKIKFQTPKGNFQAVCVGGRKINGIKLVAKKSGYTPAELYTFNYEIVG
jgi:hypothetical protein